MGRERRAVRRRDESDQGISLSRIVAAQTGGRLGQMRVNAVCIRVGLSAHWNGFGSRLVRACFSEDQVLEALIRHRHQEIFCSKSIMLENNDRLEARTGIESSRGWN